MSILQTVISRESKSFTFVGSSTSSSSTISLPAFSDVGDFAILFDCSYNNSAVTVTSVIPTSWSAISIISDLGINSMKCAISYKILTSGDLSSSIVGMDDFDDKKILLVFRPNFTIQNVFITNVYNGINLNYFFNRFSYKLIERLRPSLLFGHWRSDASVTLRGTTGFQMTEVSNTTNQYVQYAVFENNQVLGDNNISHFMNEDGTLRALSSLCLQFT